MFCKSKMSSGREIRSIGNTSMSHTTPVETVSNTAVLDLLETCSALGIMNNHDLDTLGIQRSTLSDPTLRFSENKLIELWQWIAKHSSKPEVGLLIGQTINPEGIVRNTPYRPTGPSTSAKGSKVKNTKKPVVYSVYDEYRRAIQPVNTQLASTQKVDGFAQKLFFQDSADSFIETFESACCVDLPKESPSVLGFEDSVYVEFDRDAEAYLFSEGKSPYKLIELPHVKNTYSLKLKTFVKSSSKTGVKNGVFFPQIIFLDESYEVLRIIRNPVLEYVPENWRRHGYLKGLFKIDGRDKERFMLINTTKESLRARNSIESSKVILLNNQVTGSFELEALKN